MRLDSLLNALSVDVQGFALCEISSGWRLAFGRDAAPTVHYTMRGSGVMRVGSEQSFPIGPDCFVLLPRMVRHSFEVDGGTKELVINADFSSLTDGLQRIRAGEGTANMVTACGAIRASYGGPLDLFDALTEPIFGDFADTPALRGSFEKLLDELSAPAVGTRAMIESLLKQCLVLLLRRQSSAGATAVPWLAALEDPHLAAAMSAMVERPEYPFSLDDLAVISGLRRSAFVKHFDAAFGKSPIAVLREIRLRLAARLLRTTDLPVKVVASKVGYSSRSYFSRAFVELHGVDPTRFRLSGSVTGREPKKGSAHQQPPSPVEADSS